jgi:DNA-binding FrmR family transcriptional regulator
MEVGIQVKSKKSVSKASSKASSKALSKPLPKVVAKVGPGHGNHIDNIKRLSRIKGQLEAVERMLREGRYCPEILQQVKSASSALKGLEGSILEGHLRGCVRKAFSSENAFEVEDKINELMTLFRST